MATVPDELTSHEVRFFLRYFSLTSTGSTFPPHRTALATRERLQSGTCWFVRSCYPHHSPIYYSSVLKNEYRAPRSRRWLCHLLSAFVACYTVRLCVRTWDSASYLYPAYYPNNSGFSFVDKLSRGLFGNFRHNRYCFGNAYSGIGYL